ncbi:hypothetical protein [Streptomyces sp. KHY 26]
MQRWRWAWNESGLRALRL